MNLYAASAFFVKLSLFLLYLRLFKPNKVTRRLIYLGILICGIFYSASIVSNCVLCIPRPGEGSDTFAWFMRGRKCSAPSQHLAVVQAVFSTLSDLYLVIIPIRSVFQLHLPTQKKLGVSAIFMVGIMWVFIFFPVKIVLSVLVSEKDANCSSTPTQRYYMLTRQSWIPH